MDKAVNPAQKPSSPTIRWEQLVLERGRCEGDHKEYQGLIGRSGPRNVPEDTAQRARRSNQGIAFRLVGEHAAGL